MKKAPGYHPVPISTCLDDRTTGAPALPKGVLLWWPVSKSFRGRFLHYSFLTWYCGSHALHDKAPVSYMTQFSTFSLVVILYNRPFSFDYLSVSVVHFAQKQYLVILIVFPFHCYAINTFGYMSITVLIVPDLTGLFRYFSSKCLILFQTQHFADLCSHAEYFDTMHNSIRMKSW